METTTEFTRKQYLNNECTHSEYYSQFVTESTRDLVKRTFGIDNLISAFENDKHFNSIPLYKWDRIAGAIGSSLRMRELGDTLTQSGQICILKEAAKQIIETFKIR